MSQDTTIAAQLKALMLAKRLNQRALADLLGVPLQRVKNLTAGNIQKLTREECQALVCKLNVSSDWLLTGQQPMFRKALPFGGQIDPYPQPWIPTIDSADEVGKRLAYALNTLTADMVHGFTLVTGYGAIQVAAADAEGFQRLARRMLTHALADHLAARKGQGNGA